MLVWLGAGWGFGLRDDRDGHCVLCQAGEDDALHQHVLGEVPDR